MARVANAALNALVDLEQRFKLRTYLALLIRVADHSLLPERSDPAISDILNERLAQLSYIILSIEAHSFLHTLQALHLAGNCLQLRLLEALDETLGVFAV